MDLFEYQGKQFFAGYGMPVSEGEVAFTVDEAVAAAERLGTPVMVKAQVHTGGRGKAGGVKFAATVDDAREHAGNILGLDISGHVVGRVWIEKASDIAEEYYASFTLDRSAKKHLGMLSVEGGVEIEAVAEENPDAIAKIWVDPIDGLDEGTARQWVAAAGLPDAAVEGAVVILQQLYRAYVEGDADLVEINPLVRTEGGTMVALDSKVSFDDNASFRHPWRAELRDRSEEEETEVRAKRSGLSYVKLDGNIGCLVNGAGLAMASMDVIKLYGGEPANFLDIGGGANKESITAAFGIILEDPNVEGILVTIFGGIIRCDMVARSIIDASAEVGLNVPLVVRFSGTNHEQGKEVLESSDLSVITTSTLAEGAEAIVGAIGGGD